MSKENQNWLHDLFINEAKAAKEYHNRGGGSGDGGGGNVEECAGKHVIEVEELPTENIDTTVLYECGGSYYQRVEGVFTDVISVENGSTYSLVDLYTQHLGITVECYQIKTKPTTEEELADIVVTDINNGTTMALYYIEDEDDVSIYDGSAWNPLGATGVIGDVSEATADGMYILGGPSWNNYIIPSGNITITENSTVDVTDKKNVTVDVPIPDGYIKPSETITITSNGTHDVTSYASANVKVPATYIAQTIADLPSDIPAGSLAFVLGGE